MDRDNVVVYTAWPVSWSGVWVGTLAALAVGREILKLRRAAGLHALGPELDAALSALAQGRSATTTRWLSRLDQKIVSLPGPQASSLRMPDVLVLLAAAALIGGVSGLIGERLLPTAQRRPGRRGRPGP